MYCLRAMYKSPICSGVNSLTSAGDALAVETCCGDCIERSDAISDAEVSGLVGVAGLTCAREGTTDSITRKEPETARETSFMASLLCYPALANPDPASSCLQRYQKSSSMGSFYFQWSCRLRPQRGYCPDQLHWGGGWGHTGPAARLHPP